MLDKIIEASHSSLESRQQCPDCEKNRFADIVRPKIYMHVVDMVEYSGELVPLWVCDQCKNHFTGRADAVRYLFGLTSRVKRPKDSAQTAETVMQDLADHISSGMYPGQQVTNALSSRLAYAGGPLGSRLQTMEQGIAEVKSQQAELKQELSKVRSDVSAELRERVLNFSLS